MKCQTLDVSAPYVPAVSGTKVMFRIALVLFALSALLHGQLEPKQFVSFSDFVNGTHMADSGKYLARPGSGVKDAAAFEEMRLHILTMYQGVTVSHSFLLGSHYFDCVPVEQQPSFRLLSQKKIATPPPTPQPHQQDQSAGSAIPAFQVGPDNQFDQFGNSTRCEDHTIPMRRITLEDMSRFPTLRAFLSKSRGGALNFSAPNQHQGNGYAHKYAFTQENVNNLGGNSNLNLWSPYVNTGVGGEMLSLSQQWYTGGKPTQTAEVGWQNQPDTWGTEDSVLFIYWTADDYNQTGCYNLDCSGFVQTNGDWNFGGTFTNYSMIGGPQYYFEAEFWLTGGNWWLALGGEWVGYYPAYIYGGGQMSHHAKVIQYGGEVAGQTEWPPMGSGEWAKKG